MTPPADATALALLERHQRLRSQAEALMADLPDNPVAPDDFRALAVWHAAEERAWAAYREALMLIFDDEIIDEDAALAARRGELDELGACLLQFVDFCREEIEPTVARLERGLDAIAADPGNPRYRAAWGHLRDRIRRAIPVAWRLIGPAARLHQKLPPALQEEAHRRWGPLYGTDPADFSPVWKRHFPHDRLWAIDNRARALAPPDAPEVS